MIFLLLALFQSVCILILTFLSSTFWFFSSFEKTMFVFYAPRDWRKKREAKVILAMFMMNYVKWNNIDLKQYLHAVGGLYWFRRRQKIFKKDFCVLQKIKLSGSSFVYCLPLKKFLFFFEKISIIWWTFWF